MAAQYRDLTRTGHTEDDLSRLYRQPSQQNPREQHPSHACPPIQLSGNANQVPFLSQNVPDQGNLRTPNLSGWGEAVPNLVHAPRYDSYGVFPYPSPVMAQDWEGDSSKLGMDDTCIRGVQRGSSGPGNDEAEKKSFAPDGGASQTNAEDHPSLDYGSERKRRKRSVDEASRRKRSRSVVTRTESEINHPNGLPSPYPYIDPFPNSGRYHKQTEEDDVQESDYGEAEGNDSRDFTGMSKEEVRKFKNRDKQRRLRERRANQLDGLQSESAGLKSKLSRLQDKLDAQFENAASRERELSNRIEELQAQIVSGDHSARHAGGLGKSPAGTGISDIVQPNVFPFYPSSPASREIAMHSLKPLTYDPSPNATYTASMHSISQAFGKATALAYTSNSDETRLYRDGGSSHGSSSFGASYPVSETLADSGSMTGRSSPGDSRLLPLPYSVEDRMFGIMDRTADSLYWRSTVLQPSKPPLQHTSSGLQRIQAAQAPYSLGTLDQLQLEDVLLIPRYEAVNMARFLLLSRTPNDLLSTSYAVEHAKSMRDKEIRDRGGPKITPSFGTEYAAAELQWRGLFTPAQVYLLMHVLCNFCHRSESKEWFDNMRMNELKNDDKAQKHREWQARPERDKRIELVPAMQLRYRLIERNELRDEEKLGLNEILEDMLFEGRLYGNAYEMYAWELPDTFWDRWQHVYPHGKRLCQSLRSWRRKDGHKGSEAFAIVMGTHIVEARSHVPLGLPPPGWKGDDGQSGWRAKATGT